MTYKFFFFYMFHVTDPLPDFDWDGLSGQRKISR